MIRIKNGEYHCTTTFSYSDDGKLTGAEFSYADGTVDTYTCEVYQGIVFMKFVTGDNPKKGNLIGIYDASGVFFSIKDPYSDKMEVTNGMITRLYETDDGYYDFTYIPFDGSSVE